MVLFAPRGSELLTKVLALPVEQLTFGFLHIVAIPLMACAQYECIRRHLISCRSRQLASGVLGLVFLYVLFGWDLWHLVLESSACYMALVFCNPRIAHKLIFVIALGYLSMYHIQRAYFFKEAKAVDIGAPLMILTQKMTSLGFAVYDGAVRRKRESQQQKDQPAAEGLSSNTEKLDTGKAERITNQRFVERCPTFIEFFSYTFHFSAVICGPLIFFDDYLRWSRELEDENDPHLDLERVNELKERNKRLRTEVCWKAAVSFVYICMFRYITPLFPVGRNADPEFIARTPFLGRLAYACASMWSSRFKFYLAWKLGEVGQNIAGFGYDSVTHKWNATSNVTIHSFEFATSLKSALDVWNTQTNVWLRYVCYDRISNQRLAMLCTYLLSAVWHGFFPGYYLCFLSGALFTSAARNIRRVIRPLFQSSKVAQMIYAVLTWMGTVMTITYLVVPFMLLDLQRSLVFLNSSMYWSGHIVVLFCIFVLPRLASALRGRRTKLQPAHPISKNKAKLKP